MHTTIESRAAKLGKLEVHVTRDDDGNIVFEAFTFASLSSVMGIPLTTLEGRYARSNARHHKVDLYSGAGRPMRGFPLDMLETVVEVFADPQAKFSAPGVASRARPDRVPLTPVVADGVQYFTVQALADHYGLSTTTIRNKLTQAGLIQRMVPIDTTTKGGRPRKGFRQADLGEVQLVIGEGHKFATDEGTRLALAGGKLAQAQSAMQAQVGLPDYVPFRRAVSPASGSDPHSTAPSAASDPVEELGRLATAWQNDSIVVEDNTPVPVAPRLPESTEPPAAPVMTLEQWQDRVAQDQAAFARDAEFKLDEINDVIRTLDYLGEPLNASVNGKAFIKAVEHAWSERQADVEPYAQAVVGLSQSVMGEGTPRPSIAQFYAMKRVALLVCQRHGVARAMVSTALTRIKAIHKLLTEAKDTNITTMALLPEFTRAEAEYRALWAEREKDLARQRGLLDDAVVESFMNPQTEDQVSATAQTLRDEGLPERWVQEFRRKCVLVGTNGTY